MYDLSFCIYLPGVQENAAIGLVVLQSADILGLIMFQNTFPMSKN